LTVTGRNSKLVSMTDQSVKRQTRVEAQTELSSKREQILNAAVTVFSTRGYRAALVEEIAQAAGVAKGTVYLYFKSKEEMYIEAFRENIEELHQETRQRMEDVHSTWDKIKAWITVRAEFSEKRKEFLRIYLSEFIGTFMATRPLLEAMMQRDADLLRAIFREGIEKREIRDIPVEQFVAMLQYTVGGVTMTNVSDIRFAEAPLDPEMIVAFLRQGLARA